MRESRPSAKIGAKPSLAKNDALVGIVTKDRASIVSKAISSALAQQNVRLRVCLVDDGSQDGTDLLRTAFAPVDWVKWRTPKGYMEARNFMMDSSTEEFFVSLDDDAWFLANDEVELALSHLREHEKTAAVVFDILSPDRPTAKKRTQPVAAGMFIGCGHVLRLSAVREVGFYVPTPGVYGGEEKDLSLRLLDAGYQIYKLPGVHVWHDKTTVSRDVPAQHRSGVCNDLAMTLRRTPATLLLPALFFKIWRHFQFSVTTGLISPCLRGFVLFFKSAPAIFRSRRAVKVSTLREFMRLSREGTHT